MLRAVLEQAVGLTPGVLQAVAVLERQVVEADGGRLKLEWDKLRRRSGDRVEDLLWWEGERLLGFLGIYTVRPTSIGVHLRAERACGDTRDDRRDGWPTRGQVSVVLEDGPQSVFFAGDTCYTEAVMLDQAIDGLVPERAARETLHRIRELARQQPMVYLRSHDPGAATRLVARQIVGRTRGDE